MPGDEDAPPPENPPAVTPAPDGAGWPTYATREHRPFRRSVIRAVEQLTGRRWLGKRYDKALGDGEIGGFFGRVLRELDITVEVPEGQEDRIPREGPLLIVANHPYGVIDGLVLCDLGYRTRGAFKILLHQGLAQEPRLEPFMLPVDMHSDDAAQRTNRQTVKQSLKELREGGTVLLFPAGGISTRQGLRGQVTDLPWHPLVAKLFRSARTPVVPVFFGGANSRLFQTVSQYSPTLRASVLLREMRRMRGATVQMRIGEPIPWTSERAEATDEALIAALREAVYEIGAGV